MAITAQARSLTIAAVATMLVLVDFTAVLPTVQDTAKTLGASVTWRTWALSAMSLGLAAALLAAGTVADRFGRRRTMRIGLVLLAASTALSAAAPSIAVFVAARIAQGVAGAAITVATLATVGHVYPSGRARIRATGIWGASLGVGIASGPVFSAAVARAADWRAGYWLIAALLALVAVWAGRLTESRSPHTRRFDAFGAVTLVGGMAALTAALITGRQSWTGDVTLGLLAAALVLLSAFVVIELRSAQPMLDVRLLRRPDFVHSIVGALVVGLTTIALMSYAPSYFERAIGLSALASSVLLTSWSATGAVVSWHAHRLPARLSSRYRLLLGLLACAAGLAWLAQSTAGGGWAVLLPSLILTGVGTGVTNAALGQLAVASAPPGQAGLGSGANNTARYLGGAAGVAVVIALAVPGTGTPTTAQLVHGWNIAAAVSAGLCAAGVIVVAAVREFTKQRERVPA